VTEKGAHREDEDAILTALFRYQVLGPLTDDRDAGSLRERVAEIAAREHHHPKLGVLKLSERTLWTWLRLYREGGVHALRPRERKDKGRVRALSVEALDRAEVLRREEPGRWTRFVIDMLLRESLLPSRVHRATIDRHLRRRGASRRQLRVLGEKRTGKMRFERFGDLWVGDYHHGCRVLAPDGRVVVAKLGAFIDHKTRYPVADRWYLSEDLTTLRDTMLRALLRWGPPHVAYADRAKIYRSEQLAYSLAALDCRLVHSRAYYSKGRGVIERWWQLAQAFEREIEAREELVTIHELNRLWEAFKTIHYLEHVHDELGVTPAQAIADVVSRPIDPAVARELFLVRAERHVHKSDGCVAVEGRRFLCDSSLRGMKVVVRYDPADLSSVIVFADGRRAQRAMPQPIGRVKDEPPPAPPARPKTDYLAMLRADFDRRLIEAAQPLAYSDLGAIDPGFDEARFLEVLAAITDARLRGAEAQEAHAFWSTFGPLSESLVRTALEHAVRLRGTGRHVRVYLALIRTFVLVRMKSLSNGEDT
jgi:transposase InsO family protein